MSAYKDIANPTYEWLYRAAISVDNTAGGSGAADFTVVMQKDWDLFWENVQTNGEDIRLVDADGQTLLTYDLASFNKTTRVGTLEVQNYLFPVASKVVQVFVYWGCSSAATAVTAFAPASPKSGYIDLGGPIGPVVKTTPERPGESRPRGQFAKAPSEVLQITFDFDGELQRRRSAYGGSLRAEEIDYATLTVYSANGVTDETTLYTQANVRYVDPGRVVVNMTGGTSGTDYLVECKAVTTFRADLSTARTLVRRQWVRVRNVTAS